MKTITIILLSFFSTCHSLLAQSTFVKIAGANNRAIYSQASSVTSDSGIVNVGWDDVGNSELMKFNRFGMVDWALYLTTFNSSLGCVHLFNQKLYVGGNLGNDAYVLSINSSGQKLWSEVIHNTSSSASVITGIASDSNNLYLIGSIYPPSQNPIQFLTKMDSFGNILWSKEYGTSYSGDVIFNKNLNQIIFIENSNIVAVDTSGNVIWSKSYSTQAGFTKITIQHDTDYVIIGGSDSGGVVLSIDKNGNSNWAKQYEDSIDFTYLYFNSVFVSVDNSIYVGNVTTSQGINPPTSLFKMNDSGNIVWCDSYWTGGNNGITGITSNYDGGLWLTGEAPFNYQNIFFVSRDTSSTPGCDATAIFPTESVLTVNDSNINVVSLSMNLTSLNASDTLATLSLNQFFDCPTYIPETNYSSEIVAPYPNPASETITFQFANEFDNLTIELYDALGREIHKENFRDNKAVISVEDYTSGIYFYRVEQDGIIKATGKLIVE